MRFTYPPYGCKKESAVNIINGELLVGSMFGKGMTAVVSKNNENSSVSRVDKL